MRARLTMATRAAMTRARNSRPLRSARLSLIAALLVLSVAGRAHGEEAAPPPQRDRATARNLSWGGAVLSLGVVATGIALATDRDHEDTGAVIAGVGAATLLVTPAFGSWYAGRYLTIGMGIRVAGVAAAIAGARIVDSAAGCEGNDIVRCDMPDVGPILLVGGGLVFLIGVGYDMATAEDTADAFNARHRRVSVVPAVSNDRVGIALGGTF